jgi:Protein of unknown function (DUF3325)
MSAGMDSAMAFGLCFAGMGALSLAMERHHEQLHPQSALTRHRRNALRIAGLLLLARSLACCVAGWGAGVGVVAWFGWLSAGALSIAVLLTYRPRWAVLASMLAAIASLLLSGLR